MKRATTVLFCFFVLSACGLVYAAGVPATGKSEAKNTEQSTAKRHAKTLARMEKELGLSPEQKEKVSAIMMEIGEKIKAETRKAREAVKTLREESDRRIAETLTPEQVQKFEKMKAGLKEKAKKKTKRSGGGK